MGDESNLKVDYDLLTETERSLKHIRREFRKCGTRQDELAEDVGAQPLRDAMHEFADNWSGNRKQMLANLDDVLKLVTTTRESFESTDNKLARQAKGAR
ncbi:MULTISPECIES: hypothetical protein [unclassified Streptomyces]|uniref:hypothetical protein n=1 Tax=unclassified Streptomyces TaxID=2593676 RepID=UPI00324391F6